MLGCSNARNLIIAPCCFACCPCKGRENGGRRGRRHIDLHLSLSSHLVVCTGRSICFDHILEEPSARISRALTAAEQQSRATPQPGPMAAADKEQEELAGLDRVLTRLALTEDDKLEGVLQKLLPLVIGKLNGAAPPVQKKVRRLHCAGWAGGTAGSQGLLPRLSGAFR